ncbi:MAG: hypothetical protein KKF46_06155 [Nanoarchaeota archaeon]|nr:hypothetical protein [Nanoarchaeota archaeon]MBU1321916.1 hypothetical protein [Nanoarchaeota archaeon]MBU1597609.1 hypothetical protein [Nanoarchaeota archaeon]MBU2440977.1 hypothetical protein [Nanoarchaeota archaeon]
MQETDVKTLETAGLTHAQAIIYLTLLELGQTKIGHIIEKTKLQSSVVHNNINKLIEKGLINFVMLGKIKQYSVADPEMFINYLEEQKKKIDENKKQIQEIIPKLKSIKEHTKEKTEVEVYKGKRGFKTAFTEEYLKLEPKQNIPFLALPEEFHKTKEVRDFFSKVNELAIEKKCTFQGIGPQSIKLFWQKSYGKSKSYQLRYVEENFPWDVTIFKDTILISLWGEENIIIKIKNKDFRDNALRYFNYKWKQAKLQSTNS